MQEITPYNLGWLAGIIEGEGTFTISNKTKTYWMPALKVGSNDEWVIDRCLLIAGVGRKYVVDQRSYNSRRTDGANRQRFHYIWQVYRKAEIKELYPLLDPLMSPRRRARLRATFAAFDDEPRPRAGAPEKAERNISMHMMRANGKTYREIGEAHGVTASRAYQVCKR